MADPIKALTKEEQLEILDDFFKRVLGEDKQPKAIDEAMMVEGIDDIYDQLQQGKELLIEDPQEEGAYHKLQFGDHGFVITQWVSPTGGIRTNAENVNINHPDLPEYIADPEPEQPLEQHAVQMISEKLAVYFDSPENAKALEGAKDENNQPFADQEALLGALSEGKRIYVPAAGENGKFDAYLYDGGVLYKSKAPVPAGEYVGRYEMDPIKLEPDPLETVLNGRGIVSAQNAEGQVFRSAEAIREQINSGKRLLLFDKDRNVLAAEMRDDKLFATEKMSKVPLDGEYYDIDPGRTPENERILGLRIDAIDRLETADGRTLTDPAQIREALKIEGSRNFLYTKADPEFPRAIENRGGEYYATKALYTEKERAELQPDAFEKMEDQDLEGRYLLDFKRDEIAYAIDADGSRYEGPDAIALALKESDKSLNLFLKDDDLHYEVEKHNSRFYTSKEKVPGVDALDEDVFEEVQSEKKRAMDLLEKYWGGGEFGFALDKEGKRYDTPDEVAEALMTDNNTRLFVFNKDGESPYAVENKYGDLRMSNDVISAESKLPETKAFEPKKSLELEDIIKPVSMREVSKYKDQISDRKKIVKYHEKEISKLEAIKKAGKPKELAKPTRPSMGFWNWVGYGFVKVFTFGRGDTEAHRERERLYELRKKNYAEELPKWNKKKEAWDAFEKDGETKLADHKQGLEKMNALYQKAHTDYDKAMDAFRKASKGNDANALREYQGHTEVFLDAVVDLQKTGKISTGNIFANTMMKLSACEGVKASDPAGRRKLAEYFASRTVEQQIYSRADSTAVSKPHEERLISALNNGSAYEDILKDKNFTEMMDQLGDAPISPENLYHGYTDKLAQKSYESKGYKARYADIEKNLFDTFGERVVDESCIDDLIRLKHLNTLKKNASAQVPYDEASAKAQLNTLKYGVTDLFRPIPEAEKAKWRPAVQALKGQGPMKLDEMYKAVVAKDKQMKEIEDEGPQVQA